MKILTKSNCENDNYIVIAKFPNKVSNKKVMQKILGDFEPIFYKHCCTLNYDYKNDSKVKHTFSFEIKNKERIIISGIAWDDTFEKALKENPIITSDGTALHSDSQTLQEVYILKQI